MNSLDKMEDYDRLAKVCEKLADELKVGREKVAALQKDAERYRRRKLMGFVRGLSIILVDPLDREHGDIPVFTLEIDDAIAKQKERE